MTEQHTPAQEMELALTAQLYPVSIYYDNGDKCFYAGNGQIARKLDLEVDPEPDWVAIHAAAARALGLQPECKVLSNEDAELLAKVFETVTLGDVRRRLDYAEDAVERVFAIAAHLKGG